MSINTLADIAADSTMPPAERIAGVGPWEGFVISNIAPYGENPQDPDLHRGETPWPYPPVSPNYPARFGPVQQEQVNGMANVLLYAEADAVRRPGLTGFLTQIGRGNGTVVYDVASPQLYIRPAPLPPPQELGMTPIY